MAFEVEPQIVTRYAQELVNTTLRQAISVSLSFPTSGIHLMSPDELYINSTNQTVNNQQETRYPAITILPGNITMNKTNDMPVVQQESYSSSGEVRIYESDYEIYQNYTIGIETTTKRDHRRLQEKMLHFFNQNDYGIGFYSDVLPEYDESLHIRMLDMQQDYQDAPFCSIFETSVIYRMYREYLAYLFESFIISGSIYVDGFRPESYDTILTGSLV
jgi:hypothetical protein